MKLLTNFKDYYDFIIGKYGMDEKCVYERYNKYNPHFELVNYESFIISFCNITFFGHYYLGKFYYGKDAEIIPTKILEKDGITYKHRGSIHDPLKRSDKAEKDTTGRYQTLNEKYNCPVVINNSRVSWSDTENVILNPKLTDFGFGRAVDPENAFIMISNFIMREKQIVDNQTDKEKIVSNGFDLKTSFRKM